jgi:hypothetical protein
MNRFPEQAGFWLATQLQLVTPQEPFEVWAGDNWVMVLHDSVPAPWLAKLAVCRTLWPHLACWVGRPAELKKARRIFPLDQPQKASADTPQPQPAV